ncbi:MAG: transcription antitermination factor NusB [Acidobacteriota bacterium]|nr:transcription antitermination factor NusB [Acidobacteriota bacterium]MDE2922299.1 transcription antitermination factor NusB [Acidobacteriota bacterium]MDE3265200.1 transcription antitermination factor NusB [Acidobacteriota bacterium]
MTRTGAAASEVRRAPAGKRRQAREMALQMLYQREIGQLEPQQLVREFDVHSFRSETADAGATLNASKLALAYARTLLEGSLINQESIDSLIDEQAENWRLERMPVVDRNVLRLAVYELRHQPDVPAVVVIDEAIELAKKFGSEQSGRFVNGVLDALLATLGRDPNR